MKIPLLTLLAILLLCFSIAAQTGTSQLRGRVTDGNNKAVPNLELVPANGDITTTNRDGYFLIRFSKVGPGQPTTIRVSGKWAISDPFGGRFSTQSLDNQARQIIRVLPRGSSEFLAADHLIEVGKEIIRRKTNQIVSLSRSNKQLRTDKKALRAELAAANQRIADLYTQVSRWQVITDYAYQTGLSPEDVEAALQIWANTQYKGYKEQDEAIQRSLREDWEGSALLATESMRKKLKDATRLANVKERVDEEQNKALRDAFFSAQIAGDSYRENGELTKALSIYIEIDKGISSQKNFKEVFSTEWSRLRLLVALTTSRLAEDSVLEERVRLASETIKHCQDALTVYKPDRDVLEWGAAHFLWASSLFQLSQLLKGSDQRRTLKEAFVHVNLVLKIDLGNTSNPNCPKACWLPLKAALGIIATVGGTLLGGVEGIQLTKDGSKILEEALKAFRSDPELQESSIGQLLNASTHYILAEQIPGKQGNEYLKVAKNTFERLLAVPAKGLTSKNLNFARVTLGVTLLELAKRTTGKESLEYTKSAIAQFHITLAECTTSTARCENASSESGIEVAILHLLLRGERTEAQAGLGDLITNLERRLTGQPSDPVIRRVTQIALGRALLSLGGLLEREEALAKISGGIENLEQALLAIPEADVQEKGLTQLALLDGLLALGRTIGVAKVAPKLKNTLASLEKLLSDPAQWKQQTIWVEAKLALGRRLTSLTQTSGVEEGRAQLESAIKHNEDALKVVSPGTEDWAQVNASLGHCLMMLASGLGEEQVKLKANEAIQAFERALTVWKPATSPIEWSSVQADLAATLFQIGMHLGGDQGRQKRQAAVELLKQTIAVFDPVDNPIEWATAQGKLGHALLISGQQPGENENAHALKEATRAFEQALTVLNPTNFAMSWAQTQSEYGQALSSLARQVGGDEGLVMQAAAVKAYEQALTISPGKVTPMDRAFTQANLAHSLSILGQWIGGEDGLNKLSDAAKALKETLAVFPPISKDWAQAQSELGFVQFLIAQQSDDADQEKILGASINAYEQALTVYSATAPSMEWAGTNENLGQALSFAGWLHTGEDRIVKWKAARNAFGRALEVYNPQSTAPLWAQSHVYLGNVLLALGTEPGQERKLNLNAAVQSFQKAISILESPGFEQGQMDAKNGLADTLFQLKQATAATKSYEAVLAIDAENGRALSGLSGVYHDLLFNYTEAVRFQEQLRNLHPENLNTQASLAEFYFTGAAFEESERLLTKLLAKSDLDVHIKAPLRAIEIANSLALGQAAQVPQKVDLLIAEVESQPEGFSVDWWCDGTLNFISRRNDLARQRKWILQLFGAFKGANRDSIAAALRQARTAYRQ